MARTVTGHPADDWGQRIGPTRTKKVSEAKTTEIPWTRGPQTRWQRFVRKAVG